MTKKQPVEKSIVEKDISAEEKIKQAARKLFTMKGYAATKTRDIAQEAGINLALVNYYFRSKEKLFHLIRTESLQKIGEEIVRIISDADTTLEEKIKKLVACYTETLMNEPDIPLFVLNEIRNNPEQLVDKIGIRDKVMNSALMHQLMQRITEGKIRPIHPVHFIINTISLTVFPFVAGPMLKLVANLDDTAFTAIVNERKELVPEWLTMMMSTTPEKAKKK
jgi:AcrR family transcriptional regulator